MLLGKRRKQSIFQDFLSRFCYYIKEKKYFRRFVKVHGVRVELVTFGIFNS